MEISIDIMKINKIINAKRKINLVSKEKKQFVILKEKMKRRNSEKN